MILELLAFILAVICYTVSQSILHGKFNLYGGEFWSQDGWKRKYLREEGHLLQPRKPNWYYRTFNIKYSERFPGSATIFSFVTDAYHLSQWAFKIFICLTLAPQIGLIWAGVLWLTWGIVFSVVYKYVQR